MQQSQENVLKVAERFHSVQGEGTFTGASMHFVRLAGCNVGKHPESVTGEIGMDRHFPILKTGNVAYLCHTYDGRSFWCDTDFQKGEPVEADKVLDETWEEHLCLTGGEPLLHKNAVSYLVDKCFERGILLHVESSGTIPLPSNFYSGWLTVSPKEGYDPLMIQMADEIKLLVDESFDLEKVPMDIREHANVFIQPVNYELHVHIGNLRKCEEILRKMPNWRLSVQLHKLFGWR